MKKIKQIVLNTNNQGLLPKPGICLGESIKEEEKQLAEENLKYSFVGTSCKIIAPKGSIFFINKKPFPVTIDDTGEFILNTYDNIWITNIRSDFNTAKNYYSNIIIEIYYEED